MIILLFVIFLIIGLIGTLGYCFSYASFNSDKVKKKGLASFLYHHDGITVGFMLTGYMMAGILLIAGIITVMVLSNRIVIDDKIALYETENIAIEEQIGTIVENYKGWETETYEQFKNEGPSVLISLYPELQSDTVVTKQIDLYISNNRMIKSLKEQKLDYTPMAWCLYFGK